MKPQNSLDWTRRSEEEQLAMARQASPTELRRLARQYDWSQNPEAVLGWMMAHKDMDLSSALTVFLNGDPERFNYLAKRDVPPEHRGAARVLDNVCLRVNSGFYRVRNGQRIGCKSRLERWLEFQRADRAEGRRGRWILDEAIIEGAKRRKTIDLSPQAPNMDAIRPKQGFAATRGFLAGIMGGQLARLFPRRG